VLCLLVKVFFIIMKEVQFVQNNNFSFAALQLKKYIQKAQKFTRLKAKEHFTPKTEVRIKKAKKTAQKYMDFYKKQQG